MQTHRAPKRPATSASREPLSYALGTRAKVACLRILALTSEPLSQREVARRAHLQHRSVQLALDELVALGPVSRFQGGRDYLVRLNTSHRLSQQLTELFRLEAEHFLELRRALVQLVQGTWPSRQQPAVALFGSAARGRDVAESDLDVLVIARDEAACAAILDQLGEGAESIRRRFGVRLKPLGYTLAQARRLWRQGRAPLRQAVRDGIVLLGRAPRELLDGAD